MHSGDSTILATFHTYFDPLNSSGIEIGVNFSVNRSENFVLDIIASASYLNDNSYSNEDLESSAGVGDKPYPDWSGAFGARASFLKRFRLSTLFEFKAGNYFVYDVISAARRELNNTRETADIERIRLDPSSTPEERQEATNRRARMAPLNHKADFLRWREVSLAYDLPKQIATRFSLDHAAISITGRNLLLWTGYSGINPEAHHRSISSVGTEYVNFPMPRQFSFSLRAGF